MKLKALMPRDLCTAVAALARRMARARSTIGMACGCGCMLPAEPCQQMHVGENTKHRPCCAGSEHAGSG